MKKVWGWTQFVVGLLGAPFCLWLAVIVFQRGNLWGLLLLAFTVGGGLLIRDGWKLSHPKGEKED